MPNKIDYAHMKAAETYAELSNAKRLQVGSIIVKDDKVISIGYNGTPSGWDNNCENETVELYSDYEGAIHSTILKTKPEVIHAEMNAIGKLAKSVSSGEDATMYVTHAPCFDCAKLIHIAGIKKVFYRNAYRTTDGIEFLTKCKIEVEKL
jgi:dCMP deaminase